MSRSEKHKIDMCHGPLMGKIIRFAIPLMLANISALMFHAADLIVLGQFASGSAMAAVGAAPAFTTLMLNLFWGISAGVNVLTARYIGAQDNKNISRTIHTSIAIGCFGGVFMMILGLIITVPVLKMMSVPDEIMQQASLYMWIWCLGIPFMILFSLGSAVLRSMGDTRKPLIIMLLAGVVNVLLNLLFVVVFKWDVAGVAIATKLSNVLSAVLVVRSVSNSGPYFRIVVSKIRISWGIFKEMLRIGLPAGVQGMLFSVSNVIIQSTLNSFGAKAIAGNTAALTIEGMVHAAFGALALGVVSFVGQNHGAKKYKRIMRSIRQCLELAGIVAVFLTIGVLLFERPLLGFFNPDPEVIEWGIVRFRYQFSFYFILAFMEVIAGALRGLGYSFLPTIVSLLGACVFRVLWVFMVFPAYRNLECLMISYPISWLLVSGVNGIMLIFICRRMLRNAKDNIFDDLSVKG